MRLLNTSTLQLEEFIDDKVPKYAILSHTWGKPEEEVLFENMKAPSQKALGHSKMVHVCALAKEKRLDYVWIDTCCIDKSSSAELSEAINSMYRWYQNAVICYVYLSDIWLSCNASQSKKFVESRWFTRGWTLQELLAPRAITFFDAEWQELGSKYFLRSYISIATGIGTDVLCDYGALRMKPIATKMFWASSRETSRTEDLAYCLLGIFDVNMPLLYGEGCKAFLRLQEEIIRNESEDESIYAWTDTGRRLGRTGSFLDITPVHGGMLAPSPSMFSWSSNIERIKLYHGPRSSQTAITNRSLSIRLMTRKLTIDSQWMDCYEAPLACADKTKPKAAFKLILCRNQDRTTRLVRGRMEFFGNMVEEEGFVPEDLMIPLHHTKEIRPGWDRPGLDRNSKVLSTNRAPIVFQLSRGAQEHLRLTQRSTERATCDSPGQWTFFREHKMRVSSDPAQYRPTIIRCLYTTKDVISIILDRRFLLLYIAEQNATNEGDGMTNSGISDFVDVEKEYVYQPTVSDDWVVPDLSTEVGDFCSTTLEEGVFLEVSSQVDWKEFDGRVQISLNISSFDRRRLF